MVAGMMASFPLELDQPDAAKAAYEAHNQHVRDTADPARLVEWRTGDGWAPICGALGVPVPAEPFPHVNTTAQFRAATGLDQPEERCRGSCR